MGLTPQVSDPKDKAGFKRLLTGKLLIMWDDTALLPGSWLALASLQIHYSTQKVEFRSRTLPSEGRPGYFLARVCGACSDQFSLVSLVTELRDLHQRL